MLFYCGFSCQFQQTFAVGIVVWCVCVCVCVAGGGGGGGGGLVWGDWMRMS